MLELVIETALRRFAPAAPGLLRWYCRHYLEGTRLSTPEQAAKLKGACPPRNGRLAWSQGEEDVSDWHREAQRASSDDILAEDSSFWEPICRLALADCKHEVLELLRGSSARQDSQISQFCDFLSKFPSMREMEVAGATGVEFCQAIDEMQVAAQSIASQISDKHPLRQLLEVYTRSSQADFEANKDVSWKFSRNWVEDFVFTHAWVFPDLRRAELGDLLQAVARRRQDESIDDVDRAFVAAVKCDVPALLERLTSKPDKFPQFFVVHLVDLLYYAGRLPLSTHSDVPLPLRDWHLIAYAADLCQAPQQLRFALNYLRAGGSSEVARCLQGLADRYCANAVNDNKQLWEALSVLDDLELAELGRQHCWQRARLLRKSGDLLGALNWACWAVVGIQSSEHETESSLKLSKGEAQISDFCDEMVEQDMAALLAALAPANLEESFDDCPSPALLAAMAPPGAPAPLPTLPASARLYFFIQYLGLGNGAAAEVPSQHVLPRFLARYARCHALHAAGRPTASWAPVLVKLSPSRSKLNFMLSWILCVSRIHLLSRGMSTMNRPKQGSLERASSIQVMLVHQVVSWLRFSISAASGASGQADVWLCACFEDLLSQFHLPLEDELSGVLDEDPSPFETEEVLALMRIAHLAAGLEESMASNMWMAGSTAVVHLGQLWRQWRSRTQRRLLRRRSVSFTDLWARA